MLGMLICCGEVAASQGERGIHAAMLDMAVLVSNCEGLHVKSIMDCMAAFMSPATIQFQEGAPIPKPACLALCIALLALQTSISNEVIDDLVQDAFAAVFEPLTIEDLEVFWFDLPPYLQHYFTAQQLQDNPMVATNRMQDRL